MRGLLSGLRIVVFLLITLHLAYTRHYDEDNDYIEDYPDSWVDDIVDSSTKSDTKLHISRRSTIQYGQCPESHPYLYKHGEHCCSTNKEKVSERKEKDCDGSVISVTSKCCKGKSLRCPYLQCIDKETQELIEQKRNRIEQKIKKLKTLKQFKDYLTSEESLKVFQWELLSNLIKKGESLHQDDDTVVWIFNDKDALETLLTSGDINNDNWKEALNILSKIIKQDPAAKSGLKLKLAVAVALTFSSTIKATADGSAIGGIKRYHNFAKWADRKVLLDPFYNLNAWEMRYVVQSLAKDDELVWARKHVPKKFQYPHTIGNTVFEMVNYTTRNEAGVAASHPDFYYGKPVTLETMHIHGGVCGTFCKFGAAIVQAFGIPGLPVGQPGHCAFIWLVNGTEWKLSNKIRGWDQSWTSRKIIQYTWKREAPFVRLMFEAQLNPHAYRLSEKMRILALMVDSRLKFLLLEDATALCPQNYDLYNELNGTKSLKPGDRDALELKMVPYIEKHEKGNEKSKNVAWLKPVTTSEFQNRAKFITREEYAWFTNKTESSWVEIDLVVPCVIDKVDIRWYKRSPSHDYDLLAEINGTFIKVLTEDDEKKQKKKSSTVVSKGWDGLTSKVRLEMRNGSFDMLNSKEEYIGIRQIIISGREQPLQEIVSISRAVKSNVARRVKQLVDGDLNTHWKSNSDPSWIDIKLDGICVLGSVNIDWLNDIQGTQTIQYIVGGQSYIVTTGQFRMVEMKGLAGNVKVNLKDSKNYSIREISVSGYCYSTRDIFKMRLSQGLKTPNEPYANYIIKDISKIIDEIECDSCF